eukprot:Skav212375  [mRNA]  locus=scaffold1983:97501:98478:+ [translate_table: standard]
MALSFLSLLLAHLARVSDGKLIGAAVVPHGDFAYDPKLVNDTGHAVVVYPLGQWIMVDPWSFTGPVSVARSRGG